MNKGITLAAVHPRFLLAMCGALLALALPASAGAAPVPLAQVGSAGSGAGQLSGPRGIAIDGAGTLYVADTGNSRISVFGADGTFIRAFGFGVDTGASAFEVCTTASTCQAGSPGGGAGALNDPVSVALDGAGGLYVSELDNARISLFDTAAPSFTRAFGFGVDTGASAFEVCTAASTCQAGISGGGAGQLSFPAGVALDGAGGLYIADNGNSRISVFGTAGPAFTRAFGFGVDTGASAFEVCTTASTCQAGVSGDGAGQFNSPSGIAVDGVGGLYVTEAVNRRISLFDIAGPSFTHAFGWGVDTGASAFEVCTPVSTCQAGLNGGGAGQLNFPRGAALDGAGDLYVAEQSNNRTSVFGTAGPSFTHAFGFGVDTGTSAFEVCTTASTCQAGLSGSGAGQFSSPFGVAIDLCGAAWVADSSNSRLQRIGEPGTAPIPPCQAAAGGAQPAAPSNAFTVGKLRGRKLSLSLSSPGVVNVTDAGAQAAGSEAIAAARRLLKPSSATGGPGAIDVRLKLTKAAEKRVRERGRIKVNARITFTPSGGTPNSQIKKLKVKKK